MDSLVHDVVSAAKLPSKSRPTSIKPAIAELAQLAYQEGVPPDNLRELLALATKAPTRLDQASIGVIVRNLYPTAAVPGEDVLRVVGCLGLGELKPALAVQALLLRWLILVYHALESDSQIILSRAYPVLFNLLDVAAIRAHLSHLLALITRRKHVRPFRIQALLELSRNTGGEPSLVGLLRVFKDYYPEIIVGEAVRGRASAFKHPDPQWKARLDEIREAHALRSHDPGAVQDSFRVNRRFGNRNKSIIPGVQTSHATEESVTLEEIVNVDSFVANLEKIELPSQLVAILADPLLQKLLLLRPDDEAALRIGNWLTAILQDVVCGDADREAVIDVLGIISQYVVQARHLPVVVLEFLREYLVSWDGYEAKDCILNMVPFVPLLKFDELYRFFFQPLEKCLLDQTCASQALLLEAYTRVLVHWGVILRSAPEMAPPCTADSIAALITHVNTLCLTLLQTSTATMAACYMVLRFYEYAAALFADPPLQRCVRIVPPPARLVYLILFTDSAATMSRLCSVLAAYKRGFELAMSSAGSNGTSYDRAFVNAFNGFLMDTCNCLWRSRAFSDSDTNALGCLMPRDLVRQLTRYVAGLEPSLELPSLFSLSYSPVLCRLAILAMRAREDLETEKRKGLEDESPVTRHAGPVNQRSLQRLGDTGGVKQTWQEYRIAVLVSLEGKGLGGVPELMRNTMKVLMTSSQTPSQTPHT